MEHNNGGKRYLLSVFFILLAAAMNYGITLVLTPYITKRLGTEAYGFVSLAATVANYVTIVTVAINAMATRYIAIEYHKKNFEKANQYYSTLFLTNILMSVGILLIAAILVYRLDLFFIIPADLLSDVKILFLLSILNICIISSGTVFYSATLIHNRLDLASVFKMAGYVTEVITLIILFNFHHSHVFYVGIAYAASSTVLVLIHYIYSRKTISELTISRSCFRRTVVKNVFMKGVWYSFNSLGNTLNSGLDLWVTNQLLSVLQMGQLAFVKTVTVICTALYQLIAQPFQPILLRNYAAEDKDALIKNLKLSIKANGCLSNILFAFLFVFGIYYFRLWLPDQDHNVLQYVTMITVIGTIIEGTITPLYYVYVLTLKNRIPSIVTAISGLLNVGFMFILIKYCGLGLEAVAGTTTVLSWIVNFIFNPVYVSKCLKIKKTLFYPVIIRNIASAAVMTLILFGIQSFFHPSSWGTLILAGVLCLIVGGITDLIIAFDKDEKRMLLSGIKRFRFHV